MPTTFSTALPAIATMTMPVNAFEMPSASHRRVERVDEPVGDERGRRRRPPRGRRAPRANGSDRPCAAPRAPARLRVGRAGRTRATRRRRPAGRRRRRPRSRPGGWLARSPTRSERPSSAIAKRASSSSVAVSFGSRLRNCITLASAARAPATIASPSTSSAFANSEPRIEVCATTISPAREREEDDEELGQVAERRLEHTGDRRPEPRADRLRGRRRSARRAPPSAPPASDEDDRRRGVGVVQRARGCRQRRHRDGRGRRSASREAHEAHGPVHGLERRRRRGARLVGSDGEEAQQLALVAAELAVALLDRLDRSDDRVPDVGLELAVAPSRRSAPRCRSRSRR